MTDQATDSDDEPDRGPARNEDPPWAQDAFGLETRLVRDGHRTDFDIGRVYRLTSSATAVGAALALLRAWREDDLHMAQRAIAGAAGVVYGAVGVFGWALAPSQVALWFQRRPRRALAFSTAPMVLLAVTGGAQSPLKRLATFGVATGAGVRERRRDAQMHSFACGIAYAGITLASPGGRCRGLRDAVATTVGFVLAGRVAATASQVAYDNRNMFDQLVEFTYERDDMQPYVDALADALNDQRSALLDAAEAKPKPGFSDDDFREVVLTSLGRLEERLGVLNVARRSNFELQPLVDSMRPHLRPGTSGDALASAIDTDAKDLDVFVRERAQLLLDLDRGEQEPLELVVDIDDGVVVSGLARLALIGAIVTGATTNALRHAPSTTWLRIAVWQASQRLEIDIVNDGAPDDSEPAPRRTRSGLTHLQRKCRDFGGDLRYGRVAEGGFRVQAHLKDEEDDGTEFWENEIDREIAGSIAFGARLAAAMSIMTIASSAWDRRGESDRHLVLNAMNATLPIASELAFASDLTPKRRRELQTGILTMAAALNCRAAHLGLGLSTTWVDGFASRWAFWADDETTARYARGTARNLLTRPYLLAALNVLAIAPTARSRLTMWFEHAASTGLGPLLVGTMVNPSLPRSAVIDVAANDRLSEVESLHQLADSFHAEHAAPPKVLAVAELVAEPSLERRLLVSLEKVAAAEQALSFPDVDREPPSPVRTGEPLDRLGAWLKRPSSPVRRHRFVTMVWPEPLSYHRQTVGMPDGVRLGEYLAQALARRVWPARVRLEFDDATLAYAPAASLNSARFRRKAVQAMDLVGRKVNWTFGRCWDGTWTLGQVDLRVIVIPWTGTVECEIRAWAIQPSRARRAVDALHDLIARTPLTRVFEDRDAEFEEKLELLGASLVNHSWNVYPAAEIPREPALDVPATHRPAMLRAEAVVQLHPQRYSAGAASKSALAAAHW